MTSSYIGPNEVIIESMTMSGLNNNYYYVFQNVVHNYWKLARVVPIPTATEMSSPTI